MQYSDDLRHKVTQAWETGDHTQAELADLFHVSLSWVEKVLRRWRQTGQWTARPFRHGPLPALALTRLERVVRQHPDATLAELARRLRVSPATVWRALQRLDLPRKKRPSTPASGTRLVSRRYAGLGGRPAVVWTPLD